MSNNNVIPHSCNWLVLQDCAFLCNGKHLLSSESKVLEAETTSFKNPNDIIYIPDRCLRVREYVWGGGVCLRAWGVFPTGA